MRARLAVLISLVLTVFLAGNVQAQDATWTDADPGDHLWSTPGNWSEFPTIDHWAKIRNGLPGPTIDFEGAVARRVHIGYAEGGALTMDGGTLVVGTDDLRVGKETTGTLNMISGSIDIARDLDICDSGGTGLVNMYGGTINVADDLELPNVANATGTLYMTGGAINITDNFDMLEPGTAVVNLYGGTINIGGDLQLDDPGEFDIGGGTLIVDGDAVAAVQGFIANGWITGYGGAGDVLVDFDLTNPGQTTVTAIPEPATLALLGLGALALRRRKE